MRKIFVIARIKKEGNFIYMKEKLYNNIFYSFSPFLLHARTFESKEEAEELLLTADIEGPLRVLSVWLRKPQVKNKTFHLN